MSRIGVITFPGSNCDADLRHALKICGFTPVSLWHKDHDLKGVDGVMLPGGFSYGDYLRCGAIARFSPIMEEVVAFAQKGGPVLGICNGFQILTEVGLLPGALLRNSGLKFLCQDVGLMIEGRDTLFTAGLQGNQIRLPIAHMEGSWFADSETHTRLEEEGQIIFRYLHNPNGALANIAGICNASGNVVGLMPHPERYVEGSVGGQDGKLLFQCLQLALGSGPVGGEA
jgi:phosphoribosylformylglycinamidine synthase